MLLFYFLPVPTIFVPVLKKNVRIMPVRHDTHLILMGQDLLLLQELAGPGHRCASQLDGIRARRKPVYIDGR